MNGYSGFYNTLTPHDLRDDPETGRRRNGRDKDGNQLLEMKEPNGVMRVSLEHGITGRVIPPVATWEKGSWLSEKKNEKLLPDIKTMHERWATWVVSGEGTPGNYLFRAYELPEDIARDEHPRHPSQWTKKQKEGEDPYSYSWGKPKDPGLPTNLKIRCPGCGHWYSETDLKNHVTSACPGQQGGSTDWIIPCFCCANPDVTATVKDGYPKQVKAPDPPDTGVAVKDNLFDDTEPPKPDDGVLPVSSFEIDEPTFDKILDEMEG